MKQHMKNVQAKIKKIFNAGFFSLAEIEDKVIELGGFCASLSCNLKIRPGSIRSYPDENGRIIKNKELKHFVFFDCNCGYGSALWKVENRIGHTFRG